MTTEKHRPSGVLGRGPAFWAVMVFISTALIVTLSVTGAIEQKAPLLLLTIVPVSLAMVMFRAGYKMADSPSASCGGKGAAQKTYIKRTAIFTSLYLATFGLLMFADREIGIEGELKFALALLPGLAICGIFWAIGRLIVEEKDEFMRMLVVRQALVATSVALSAATVWGFLESADVVPHVDAYWWAVAWFFGLFLGALANRVQYGTWGAV
ncbi:hypothetical protein [Erythrobacter rubeus]|uniref:DUF2178 domain-containing protein n=1 Tax=Erythrobacter rubeus TaxID=2760803 RepID=A0ABR8KV28_9SPHN|nr:hypothetical protein [Erythrobacter rubeus]MBD2843073.1 hypothetical protein [Erythrobacter rubeus]